MQTSLESTLSATATSSVQFLSIPGYGGSGPGHWHHHWQARDSRFRMLEQVDWENPERDTWVDALEAELARMEGPVVLVPHSLGVSLLVHALARRGNLPGVVGAFLVAMPDVDAPGFPPAIKGFHPLPLVQFPFPAVMIGSRNDPYSSFDALEGHCSRLCVSLLDLGDRHHIGDSAGLGSWEEGWSLFRAFLAGLGLR